jgi:hypothetical protein
LTNATYRAIVSRIAFYATLALFILAVWQFQPFISQGVVVGAQLNFLDDLQKRDLDAFLDMNSLITTLTTGLLGALGFLLLNGRKVDRGPAAKWLAFGSALCAALSLFFGYVVYISLSDMLGKGGFDLTVRSISWPRQAHFYLFLMAVLLFGDFAFHAFFTGERHEHHRHPVHR